MQGSAEYIDDIPEPIGTLHIAVGGTPVARGTLRRLDLSEVRNAPGVVAVVTAADIPGKNDISPGSADEPVLVQDTILFHHQPVFAVAATSRDAARRAVLRAKIEVDAEAPNVSVEQGRASGETVMPDYAFINGDAAKTIAAAPLRSTGKIQVGGQEHFYLEGQVALAVPGEDGDMLVHSSTQHPSEVQHSSRAARRAGQRGHRRGAPHGRRFRRQGDAGDAMGGDRRARCAHDRPARASSGSIATTTWS